MAELLGEGGALWWVLRRGGGGGLPDFVTEAGIALVFDGFGESGGGGFTVGRGACGGDGGTVLGRGGWLSVLPDGFMGRLSGDLLCATCE